MNNRRIVHRDESGFSLIELMVVMIVLAALAGITMMAVNTLGEDAEQTAERSNEEICATARAVSAVQHDGDDSHWADYLDDPASC